MKKIVLSIFAIAVIFLHCTTTDEEPLLCHLYGWVIEEEDSTTGVNNLLLKIWHINPDDLSQLVLLDTVRTRTEDSQGGFFEMDSVCYGTTKQQGHFVTIIVDSTQNPGWHTQFWYPDIYGEVDTITLYITE